MAGGLTSEEKAATDKAIIKTYQDLAGLLSQNRKQKGRQRQKEAENQKKGLIPYLRIFIEH